MLANKIIDAPGKYSYNCVYKTRGVNMKKTVLVAGLVIMTVSSANAGWLSGLFGQKDAEPQTLEQACNKDEITSICPDVILGEKTIQECLKDNVSKLSKKCANFVKKSATEKIDSVKQQVVSVKTDTETIFAEQKQELKTQKAALKEAKAAAKEAKAELKKSIKDAKAAVVTEKEQIKTELIENVNANAQ